MGSLGGSELALSVVVKKQYLLSLLLLSLTLSLAPSDAFAQSGFSFVSPAPGYESPDQGSAAPPSASYGWQIGLVDGASILLFLSGAGSDNESTGMLGIGGYLLGGPMVHSGHGHHGRALGSLALRVGLPVLLAKVAVGFDNCDPQTVDYCGEDELAHRLLGGMIGVLAASSLDWFVLGREEADESRAGIPLGGLRLQPTLVPTASGAQLGVVGHF